jgi:hypothetical protein
MDETTHLAADWLRPYRYCQAKWFSFDFTRMKKQESGQGSNQQQALSRRRR